MWYASVAIARSIWLYIRAMKPKTYKYKGESKTLGEWAKQLGIPYNNLYMRLMKGWDFARAVEEPIRPRGEKGKKKGKGRRKCGTEEGGEDTAPKTGNPCRLNSRSDQFLRQDKWRVMLKC